MKKFLLSSILILSFSFIFSQEKLKSFEEEYYDFLSLQGIVERPTLGYRTLSDSVWELPEDTEHIWSENNLGSKKVLWESDNQGDNWFTQGFYHGLKYKLYGPEWFNSYNTASPYGQNDGALWQGRGYNTSLTSGARIEGFGLEVTLLPEITFNQNLPFSYTEPAYSGNYFDNKASLYGYYGVSSIDYVQRFGNSPFFTFDLGDSEVRYTFHNFTTGFGNQNIWIGPAKNNSIIHSNNAPGYLKFDIGLKRTELYWPNSEIYLGDLEFRTWWGKTSESDYFDNNIDNNNNLITGLSFNYGFPGIFNGLSFGFNRTMLSHWNSINKYSLFNMLIPDLGLSGGTDESDQRFSLTLDYLIPIAGMEIYFEWARNDFSPSVEFILRYPFHTQAWTFGLEKIFTLRSNDKIAILLELTGLETSSDYDRLIPWYTTFYSHHLITQGYTNKGQLLGAGIGTGSNSQYLGIKWINKYGYSNFFLCRTNPDLDYTMYIDTRKEHDNGYFGAEGNIRLKLDFGTNNLYYIKSNISILFDYIFEIEMNPTNYSKFDGYSEYRFNNIFHIGFKYKL